MSVEVRVDEGEGRAVATVTVQQRGTRTEHRVMVTEADVRRYGARDVADLVRRSFEFLLEREPNTSILREFHITAIERYFPEYRETISAK